MASPLRHDFFRTFRSWSVIGSMVALIALSLVFIPVANIATSVTVFGSGGQTVLYYTNGPQVNFLAYSFNTYGQPAQGTDFSFSLSSASGTVTGGATTNSTGLATWSIQLPSPQAQVNYTLTAGGRISTSGSGTLSTPNGTAAIIMGTPLATVTDPSNSSRMDVLFIYEGPNGSVPTGYRVYYNFSAGFSNGAPSEQGMTLLGATSAYVTVFKLPPFPARDNTINVAAFDSTGSVVSALSSTFGGGPFIPPTPKELLTSFISSIFSLIVPLMAVLVAYNSYGKDRASGVLDSVLTRPVTRRGLGLARYLSMIIAITVAIAIAVGVMAVIAQIVLGSTITLDFAASTIGGLAVEGAAFVGIILLVARLIRSQGGLIGIGVVLWVFLDFAWGIFIVIAAYASGIQIGSGDYLALSIRSSFINPAQFYTLVGELLNGVSLLTGAGGNTPISPANYGLTPYSLVAVGLFWVLAPLAGFLYLSTKRD